MKRLVSACLAMAFLILCAGANDAGAVIRIKNLGKALNDNPGMKWTIINGSTVVPKGNKVYAMLDTVGSKATGTPSWTLTKPGSSTTTLDSTGTYINSFTADTLGFYYLSVTIGGQTAIDTIFAGTYKGIADVSPASCACHGAGPVPPKLTDRFNDWQNTGHSQIFAQGISGQLEVDELISSGLYKGSCVQCHTVGWEPAKNNGNFGYVAHWTVTDTSHVTNPNQNGWDSTWFAGLPLAPDGSGDFLIPTDPTRARFNAMPANLQALGTIGCESCHGPLNEHATLTSGFAGQPNTAAASLNPSICNQCHNGSTRHTIGAYYNKSLHATYPPVEPRSNCAPCHQGYSFVYWAENGKDTTGWASKLTDSQLNTEIGCVACHDPHKAATINADGTLDPGLRQVSVDSLRNGYRFTPVGTSEVCSFCHTSRYSVTDKVQPNNPPYYGFAGRFGPHENPQYDMFVGSNGYQFGDTSFTGVNTHMGLENGCVTCHMQDRIRIDPVTGKSNNNPQANHGMSMTDTTFGFKATAVCADCHGEIEDFNDVKAFYDFDRNGKIEGVQTEIQGLLNQVFNILPHDTVNGVINVIGSGSVKAIDSAKIKNRPDLVAGIWNYRFVTADGSMGVHNAQYAARLLYKTLGWTPLWVKDVPGAVPATYTLDQNYPNPFNPSTVIRFSLPKEGPVKLQVFDITGSLVKTLLDEAVRAGNKEVTWDGTNQAGVKVASGMYLYRLESANFVATKKMLLLK
jgi:hypothetical protein